MISLELLCWVIGRVGWPKKGDPLVYYYTFCEAGSKGIFCYWVVGMT